MEYIGGGIYLRGNMLYVLVMYYNLEAVFAVVKDAF